MRYFVEMKKIKQRNSNDCGICCIAMLANISYEEAKENCFQYEKRKNDSIRFELLPKILKRLNLNSKIYNCFQNDLKSGLLEISYIKKGIKKFHYIVFNHLENNFIDPQNDVPKNFEKLRFIEVI